MFGARGAARGGEEVQEAVAIAEGGRHEAGARVVLVAPESGADVVLDWIGLAPAGRDLSGKRYLGYLSEQSSIECETWMGVSIWRVLRVSGPTLTCCPMPRAAGWYEICRHSLDCARSWLLGYLGAPVEFGMKLQSLDLGSRYLRWAVT